MKKSLKISSIVFAIVLSLMIFGCIPDENIDRVKVYDVYFIANNEVVKAVKVKENEKVDKIDAPIIEGKVFEYWRLNNEEFDFETPIAKDINLVAKYQDTEKQEKYIVKFIMPSGNVEEVEVEKDSTVNGITPITVENYEFKYWLLNGNKFDFNTKITSDITLVAVYEQIIKTYKVTYVIKDGNISDKYTIEVYENELALEMDAPAISGKEFVCWTLNDNEYDFSTPVTKNITLYAKYDTIENPIVIDYWHANGAESEIVLQEIKTDFEAKYNGKYVVRLVSYGNYDTLRDTITGGIAIGVVPTAAQTYPDHVALYLEGNALVSLDRYINDPVYGMSKEEQSQFVEGFWAEGVIYDEAGTRYAMPFNKSTELMYYNKDMFDKYGWNVPTTWDEVIDICEKFKLTPEYQRASTAYDGLVYGLGYDSEANLFITFTQQYGATYTSFDVNGQGVYNAFGGNSSDTMKSKEALNWYYQQYLKKNVATPSAFGAMYCSDAFKNGQCIMIIGSSAGARFNDGQYSTQTRFTTGVAPVPQKDLKNGQVIQQGTNVSLFKCNNPEVELGGWLWLKHLVSYESALKWAIETSYLPIRKDVIHSKEYQNHINGIYVSESGEEVQGTISLIVAAKRTATLQQNWFYTNMAFPGSSRARDKAETLVQRLLYGSNNPTIDQVYKETYDSLMTD